MFFGDIFVEKFEHIVKIKKNLTFNGTFKKVSRPLIAASKSVAVLFLSRRRVVFDSIIVFMHLYGYTQGELCLFLSKLNSVLSKYSQWYVLIPLHLQNGLYN